MVVCWIHESESGMMMLSVDGVVHTAVDQSRSTSSSVAQRQQRVRFQLVDDNSMTPLTRRCDSKHGESDMSL